MECFKTIFNDTYVSGIKFTAMLSGTIKKAPQYLYAKIKEST